MAPHGQIQEGCWFFSLGGCSIIVLITLLICINFIYGLCSKKYTTNPIEPEPSSIYRSAALCVATGLICNIILFTTYPICHIYETCGDNFIGDFYFISIFDAYLLNKIFMYLSIIYRLFDTYTGTDHHYGKPVFFTLYILLFFIFCIILLLNISIFFNLVTSFLTWILVIIYVLLDILLSIFTLYLYIRPLSKLIIDQIKKQKYSMSQDLINSVDFRKVTLNYKNNRQEKSASIWDGTKMEYSSTIDYVNQTDWDFSNKTLFIMIKFLVLILFAIVSNIILGSILIIRFSQGWYHSPTQVSDCFLDFSGIFYMLEVLISCTIVYLSFKFSNNIYIRLCSRCHTIGFNCIKRSIKRVIKNLTDDSYDNVENHQEQSGKSDMKSNLLSADAGEYKVLVPSYATQDLNI